MEDRSKAWDEDMYAFETEAKDMLSKRQDVCESAGRAYWDHRMKLYVWYGFEAHRPLGNVKRVKGELCQASAARKEEINALRLETVSSVDQIP